MAEVYEDKPKVSDNEVTDEIYEGASDSASVYTNERLAYLNNQNESDISDVMSEYGEHSIANACAIWYDRQVEQAAIIIKDWVNNIECDHGINGNVHTSDCKLVHNN